MIIRYLDPWGSECKQGFRLQDSLQSAAEAVSAAWALKPQTGKALNC